MKARLVDLARRHLSVETRRKIARYAVWPPVGWVRLGSLGRLRPISRDWGMERGDPIDRYYIERFLARQAEDIRGRVLEIGDNRYTRQFRGDRVSESVILHVEEQKEGVTLIGDLVSGTNVPTEAFDCALVTQTLQFIFDVPAAIQTIHRLLKPGGVALITVSGISQISRYDMDHWGHYWSFTSRSLANLFAAAFPSNCVQVEAHGNVLAAVAFLHGLAWQELSQKQLDYLDPDYELLLTVRAQKPGREF